MELNPKQRRFVSEYLVDQNGTQAAIRAGYSKQTAKVQAAQLLTKLNIKAAVEEGLKKIEEKNSVSVQYVLDGLKEVAERCMQRVPVMVFDKVEKEMVQVTETVKDPKTGEIREEGVWEFDSSGANRALELLGKYKKMFSDKLEVSGNDGGAIIVKIEKQGSGEPWKKA